MRRPAEWMTNSADDRILEYLSEHSHSPPKEIADITDFHPEYIGRRCRTLQDHGLLENLGRGLYRITDSGEEYLAGELDASSLEDDVEEDSDGE